MAHAMMLMPSSTKKLNYCRNVLWAYKRSNPHNIQATAH